MRILLPVAAILIWTAPVVADDYERQPGIDVLHYEIALELTDSNDSIVGTTRLRVAARQSGLSSMWLDFDGMAVDSFSVDGSGSQHDMRAGRLHFSLGRPRAAGETLLIEVRYHGELRKRGLQVAADRAGKRAFFAENWPDNAHHWFPCIDHPSDKASVEFQITAPAHYEVVANGSFEERRTASGERAISHWYERTPIPTYCMVIAAAEYTVRRSDSTAKVPLSYYFYPADTDAAAFKFARTDKVLNYFAATIASYPYEKLAQLETTTPLGGMENAGAIFYSEGGFRSDARIEAPVPHEIAHQWFGDSVTEGDWDHLWLSEGFATYLDALFYEYADGEEAFQHIMGRAADTAMKYMRNHPDPVINPAMKDISRKLNPLNYEKGAWILHMLRKIVGDQRFFEGLRQYYAKFAGKNALTEDFQRVMEAETGEALGWFFDEWLLRPGWPAYKVRWSWLPKSQEVGMTVTQSPKAAPFDMPVAVEIRCGDRRELRTLRIFKASQEIRIPATCKPTSLTLDPGGWVLKTADIRPR